MDTIEIVYGKNQNGSRQFLNGEKCLICRRIFRDSDAIIRIMRDSEFTLLHRRCMTGMIEESDVEDAENADRLFEGYRSQLLDVYRPLKENHEGI